jgi:hypothetical protein
MKSLKHITTLHDLLRLGIDDMKRAKACGHTLNMGTWLDIEAEKLDDKGEPVEVERCAVCLAGSVLLWDVAEGRYDLCLIDEYNPCSLEAAGGIDLATMGRLYALNSLRCGNVFSAYRAMFVNGETYGQLDGYSYENECAAERLSKRYEFTGGDLSVTYFESDDTPNDDRYERFVADLEVLHDKLVEAGI